MSPVQRARYLDVLALPHVPLTFAISLVGRTGFALVFLPLLFAIFDATGSYAAAGVALGLYGAGAGFLGPLRAWCVDRAGARPALTTFTVAFAAVTAGIAILSFVGANVPVFTTLATLAGAVAPPLGPTMRVVWGELCPGEPELRTGLSLDAIVEDVLYLGGPAVAGFLLAGMPPGLALLVPAALIAVGGTVFASLPAVRALRGTGGATPKTPAGSAARSAQATEPINDASGVRTNARPRRPKWRSRREFRPGILLPVVAAGALSGGIGVAVPSLLADSGGPAAAGIALGAFACGSMVGGLLFGGLPLPLPTVRQLRILALAFCVACAPIAIATGSIAVPLALGGAGLFFAPILIAATFVAQTQAHPAFRNGATTWVTTAHNIGAAAGSALAGAYTQTLGGGAAIGILTLGGLVLVSSSALLGSGPDKSDDRRSEKTG
ncbi:hypothetical protein JD292_05670 [Leucobacter sp. CSA2]|uniref:MFS transporter n=1 Tax=Leucobacter edaphi TaxID=2796472 RepID=A0A934QE33_9MICO|nr:MFS transporter [Leucobacter edaphi]MBK0421557.1 hypothetical protein [Leucobacter edaphi]